MLSDWVISFHENTHGAYAGGYVGEYFLVILRLVLGNSASTVGNISGGFVSVDLPLYFQTPVIT